MCGITGIFYFDKLRKIQATELEKMTLSIRHRGPDDVGYYYDENLGLGFRRLSIIDVKSGHQPLCDNSKRYWITFNGEIYNYVELRNHLISKGYYFKTNTDTEVIVNLFAEYREGCLKFLRGMFSFVIWDNIERSLFGARDRFGIKPFHYYLDHKKLVWGSEIKSILFSNEIDKTISIKSLDYYFAYGYTPRNNSIYKNIQKLRPGHYFIIKENGQHLIDEKSYWNILFDPDYSKSEEYWIDLIRDKLEESVRLRMRSDVPLGAFLSGGIDSSAVVALMSLNSSRPIKTFSIGFKEEKYNELKYAKILADKYNTEHHEFIIEPESIDLLPKLVKAHDEPFADSSSIPTYYVSKFTRKYVTVALSGDGGDEMFAGYNAYSKLNSIFSNKIHFRRFFSLINMTLPDYMYGKGMSYLHSKNKYELPAFYCFWKNYERWKVYNKEIRENLTYNCPENIKINLLKSSKIDFISSMQKLDMQTYMVDGILTKVDRASMMNSLEVRVPLLDHELAELSFKIPSKLKMNQNNKKYILKKALEGILPNEIVSHKKQGFAVPLDTWFKGDLKSFAYDRLLNSKDLYEYLDRKYVNNILDYHQKGLRNFSSKIWHMLFFEEWLSQQKKL